MVVAVLLLDQGFSTYQNPYRRKKNPERTELVALVFSYLSWTQLTARKVGMPDIPWQHRYKPDRHSWNMTNLRNIRSNLERMPIWLSITRHTWSLECVRMRQRGPMMPRQDGPFSSPRYSPLLRVSHITHLVGRLSSHRIIGNSKQCDDFGSNMVRSSLWA